MVQKHKAVIDVISWVVGLTPNVILRFVGTYKLKQGDLTTNKICKTRVRIRNRSARVYIRTGVLQVRVTEVRWYSFME